MLKVKLPISIPESTPLMEEADLFKWAVSSGIRDDALSTTPGCGHSLTIATFPQTGGRGLAAARDLKEGELILVVPEAALLNVNSFKEDKPFIEALQRFPLLSSFQVLVSLLLREVGKGSSSRWFPYLTTLPQYYHTFSQFSDFEIQALQAEDAIWTAERAVTTAHKEWTDTKPFLHTLGLKSHLIKWKAWQWACSTVSSRTLHVSWCNAGTLCPVGDFFNYAPAGNIQLGHTSQETVHCHLWDIHVESPTSFQQSEAVRLQEIDELDTFDAGGELRFTDRLTDGGYDVNSHSYCFYAREDYKKGDQVFLCYGLYSNLELLEHYGFILNENPNDKVFIRLDSLSGFVPDLLPDQFRSGKLGSIHIEVDGRPSFQLLAALRLCCASKEVRQQQGHLALCGLQLSEENDLIVYQWLREKCSGLLESFPSNMQMDSALGHLLSLCSSYSGLMGLLDLIGNPRLPSAAVHKLLLDSVCDWSHLYETERVQVIDELQKFSQQCSCCPGKRVSLKEQSLQMERWWLSIKWRFHQKRILTKCIAFCAKQILLLGRKKIR